MIKSANLHFEIGDQINHAGFGKMSVIKSVINHTNEELNKFILKKANNYKMYTYWPYSSTFEKLDEKDQKKELL